MMVNFSGFPLVLQFLVRLSDHSPVCSFVVLACYYTLAVLLSDVDYVINYYDDWYYFRVDHSHWHTVAHEFLSAIAILFTVMSVVFLLKMMHCLRQIVIVQYYCTFNKTFF
jgi:hypothetical protein